MFNRVLAGLALAAVALGPSVSYAAITWNFYGPSSNLGPSETFLDTTGTHSLTATALNIQSPPDPTLSRNLFGIGVDLGFGDNNQVDNGGDDEAIIFDLGSVHTPVEINLSLANNGGLFTDGDQYRIYGNNTGVFTSCTTGSDCLVGDLLATGTGAGSLQITNVGLPGSTPYRYIIAGLPGGSGDGYRVAQLSMETANVPLPPSIALLGVALAALGFGARRLSQNAS